MKLDNDVELLEGMPIAHISSLSALAVSDLHLGYESVMAKKGALLPKVNLKKILHVLEKALDATKAKRIIVVGDIKNDFSGVDEDEFNELYELIRFTRERKVDLTLIKGNHDNFVERYKEPFRLTVFNQEARLGKYLFFHGDVVPAKVERGTKYMIMGHEHPAIGVADSIGKRQKLRCFLYGRYKGTKLLVLPAMNYFAGGTDVNVVPKSELLSPIFKAVDINRMHAVALGYGSTIDFGTVGRLRGL